MIPSADCLYCDGEVEVEFAGSRFDDRYNLVLEVEAWCDSCVFNYHGDVSVEKVGGSLNYAMAEENNQ